MWNVIVITILRKNITLVLLLILLLFLITCNVLVAIYIESLILFVIGKNMIKTNNILAFKIK